MTYEKKDFNDVEVCKELKLKQNCSKNMLKALQLQTTFIRDLDNT